MRDDQITVTLDDGTEVVCNILFTHEGENGKNFVVFEFTDTFELSAAIYNENPDNPEEGTFEDIVDDADWELIEELLAHYYEDHDDPNL